MLYKHFCGPDTPIIQVSGTKVLDPFNPYIERLSDEEAINILVITDPRRKPRNRHAQSIKFPT